MALATNCRPLSNYCIGTPVSVYYLFTQLSYDHVNCGAAEGTEFHPFGKSVLHYEQPGMPIGGAQ